jgi:hypothetical protein
VQDVNSFVTVMIQSQTFGTSIADALRVYANDMRDKRVMRAEEAANKIPTKMTLGTMMFTVPPLLIILVGPSVHDMMETFKTEHVSRWQNSATAALAPPRLSPLRPLPPASRPAALGVMRLRPMPPAPPLARRWTG